MHGRPIKRSSVHPQIKITSFTPIAIKSKIWVELLCFSKQNAFLILLKTTLPLIYISISTFFTSKSQTLVCFRALSVFSPVKSTPNKCENLLQNFPRKKQRKFSVPGILFGVFDILICILYFWLAYLVFGWWTWCFGWRNWCLWHWDAVFVTFCIGIGVWINFACPRQMDIARNVKIGLEFWKQNSRIIKNSIFP